MTIADFTGMAKVVVPAPAAHPLSTSLFPEYQAHRRLQSPNVLHFMSLPTCAFLNSFPVPQLLAIAFNSLITTPCQKRNLKLGANFQNLTLEAAKQRAIHSQPNTALTFTDS